ncbi:MAG: M20/M25/M40 family metallo-hydrolase [Phycisphaerales bacterium]|nr:M20/M25/M40 family metallo-hydrolase [Phycisphaerales bacterium]
MGLSEHERTVCDAISRRRDALLDDLRSHVETPTGGGNTDGLNRTRELLTRRAARLGATVEHVRGQRRPQWLFGSPGYGDRGARSTPDSPPTAVCRRELGLKGVPLLISGHLDTVHDPSGPFQQLTLTPDGVRGIGPGCVDMKGGLVITLAALECLDECGIKLPWTLLLNSDEETGSYHSERTIFAEASRVATLGGVGIAVEPGANGSEGALVVARAGSGQFFIEVTGKAAHVGRDFASGISAVNALAELILKIAALSEPARDLIVNIGPIEGGTATNAVPDRARGWGNVRFPDQAAAGAIEARLRTLVSEAQTGAIRTRLESSFIRAAKPLTPDTQRLADMARAASLDLGRELPFTKTAGVCDGNVMQAAGLPTLDTLGVRGGGLHTPEEWIEIPSLVDRCQLLAVFMIRAAGSSELGPLNSERKGG